MAPAGRLRRRPHRPDRPGESGHHRDRPACSGKVQWVGMIPAARRRPAKPRIVAVVEQKKWVKNEDGNASRSRYSIVDDPALGKTYDPDARSEIPEMPCSAADAFLLDRKHRLWLVADNGEWGGWCSYVDLDAGKVHSVPGRDDFGPTGPNRLVRRLRLHRAARRPGLGLRRHRRTWTAVEGFIWRVDRGKAEELYRLDNGR